MFLPFAHLSNSLLNEQEAINQMAEWGFEFFRDIANYDNYSHLPFSQSEFDYYRDNFTIETFNLVKYMMIGTKSNWSNDELLTLLQVGNQYFASGKAYFKITNIISKAIMECKLDANKIDQFFHLKRGILFTTNSLCNFAVNDDGNKLQLNGLQVAAGQEETVLKYFLNRAKFFSDVQMENFKIIKENILPIENHLENRLVSFYTTRKQASINSQSDFPVKTKLLGCDYFHFSTDKIQNIQQIIELIPSRSLLRLDICHETMHELLNIFMKIMKRMNSSQPITITGDLDAVLFEKVYFEIKESIIDDTIFWEYSSRTPSFIKLFTSSVHQTQHQQMLKISQSDSILDSLDFLNLNLTAFSPQSKYQLALSQRKVFTSLNVIVDCICNLQLLSQALSFNQITKLRISFHTTFYQYGNLLRVIKNQNLESFALDDFYIRNSNEEKNKFLINLMETPLFCHNLEYFYCKGYELETLMQVLTIPMPKLTKLHLFLNNYSDEFTTLPAPINSVKQLILEFCTPSSDNRIINPTAILSIFPMIENLTIKTTQKLESFTPNENGTLREIDIECKRLIGETEFIKHLINSTNFNSIRIQQFYWNIEWKRQHGRIYYEFQIKKSNPYKTPTTSSVPNKK